MNIYEREINNFRQLNKVANTNGVVLFGSTFAKNIPVCELKQSFDIDCDMYNRSITDLSVFDAEALLEDCVTALAPKTLLIQLGETDLERGFHTIPEIIEAYEKIVAKLKSADKHCDIVIISVCESAVTIHPEELNKQLELAARRMKCKYADISSAFYNDSPGVKAFSLLSFFMQNDISFFDAMKMLHIWCLNYNKEMNFLKLSIDVIEIKRKLKKAWQIKKEVIYCKHTKYIGVVWNV